MRIRSLLVASALLAALVTACVGSGLAWVTRRAQASLDEQNDAQQVARHVVLMLALTNEFTVFGGERVAVQWRSRLEQLQATVQNTLRRQAEPSAELLELQRNIADLPPLFDTLVRLAEQPPTPLSQRRRELLLERLLAETQEVLETRHRWAQVIADAQRRDQALYTAMVIAAPAALLLLLVSLGLLVGRRVLRPLLQLQTAVLAMERGDLSVRCASNSRDELGDTARAVDAMALALQQQSAALQASERRLRLITDSIPALVGYVDTERRYDFVNAHYQAMNFGDAESLIGRTLGEVHGARAEAMLAPHVERALAGQRARFDIQRLLPTGVVHVQATFVPDIDDAGRVRGFYTLGFDITERKEAELQREASEKLLTHVTDNITALIAYIDGEHRYRFANSKYRDWMGVEPAAMVGRHVGDAMGAEFYDAVRDRIERALTGETVRSEGHALIGNSQRHFMATHIPDIGADGSVRGCFVMSIDITERRDAELTIAASERRLHELTNSIPATVCYFDLHERCLYANDAGLRAQGVALEDVGAISLRTLLGDAAHARHAPQILQAMVGQPSTFEGAVSSGGHPSRPARPSRFSHYQAHLVPDLVPGGSQRGFYLMTFDITALKEAEQNQARVERQLRGITDNLPVLISYVDRDQRYGFLNATFKDWLGIDPAVAIGSRMADVVGPAVYADRQQRLLRALAGERVEFTVEASTLGGRKELQTVYVPDLQPDATVAGVFTISSDVTVLKQIQQQLQDLARVDVLTQLANRRHFEEKLAEGMARAARGKRPIALMFLDIDHFKAINDGLGHAAGDAVLKEFASRLKRAVRKTDTPARLAGDEFVVMLEDLASQADAERVAEKIVAMMRKPFSAGEQSLLVTTSVGVAFCPRPGPQTALMEAADEALYGAKRSGRNAFRVQPLDAVVSSFGSLPTASRHGG